MSRVRQLYKYTFSWSGTREPFLSINSIASSPITSWRIGREKVEAVAVTDFIFLYSKITVVGNCSHKIKTCLLVGRKVMTNLDSVLKNRDISLPAKVCILKALFFSSNHVQMWELGHKEGWAPKNCCFQTVVLEKSLENPLDYKEIKPVDPKGNQPWILIERTDAEAEALILWPPDAESILWKNTLMPGKDWRQKGVGGRRRWDCYIASVTQWTWIWENSGR